ncbi:MAG TPA: DUF4388 domain-containing protein [Thermoanaerobaculia bacterium]|nr:DUF4388 domain-containing protein [Thermoanaerobaculia bacterium]
MQLEGHIRDINVVDRMVELWRDKFTGAFRFEQDGVIKILYFKDGDVLSASTNDRVDAVDEILLRAGKVSREHIKQALAKRKESETLGDALLNLGFITRKELTWARRVQVIGILRSISTWQEGQYTGVADYLPKREEGTLFPLPQVILELIVTESDRARFEQATDSGAAVFAKTGDFDDGYRRLGLNEDADAIVAEIDGERSAADVAATSGADAFNVYKLLEALRALGLVTRIERTHGAAELSFDDFAAAGVSDASDAWEPTVETPIPADVPMTIPVAAEPEPAWGFDEAQIETAQRAAEPPPPAAAVAAPAKPKAKSGSRWGAIVAVLLVAVLGFAGWYGWTWWQGRSAAVPAAGPAGSRGAPLRPKPTTAPTVTTATTATVAPPPKPAPKPAGKPAATTAAAAPPPTRLERSSTGAATITNTASAAGTAASQPAKTPARPDALRAKYDSMAKQAAADPVGSYTVQFELVCETSSITKAMEAGRSAVWWLPISYRGKPCYRVFWGRFSTREEAVTAAKEIPAALHGSTPVVVKIPR